MNKLDQFIAWLLSWVNLAIYVWGGQGETITSTKQINRMETSKFNVLRVIVLWIRRGRKAVCFDCSGLLVAKLLSIGLITYDTTANGLMSRCERITKAQLKRGDWVFRVRDGKAYHIGVVVDNNLNVVEAMGRDDGVVKRGIDQHSVKGYWTTFGRPTMLKTEIEYVPPKTDKVLFAFINTVEDMNLRATPDPNGKIIEVCPQNTRLGIVELSGNWGRIQNSDPAKWINTGPNWGIREY